MPRPTNLTSFDELLDDHYGPKGTPEREAFQTNVEFARVGEAIRAARLQQGLSQAELGERLGIGKAQISKLENSIKNARLDTIERVFRALGMKSRISVEMAD